MENAVNALISVKVKLAHICVKLRVRIRLGLRARVGLTSLLQSTN